jgi:DNA polymerase
MDELEKIAETIRSCTLCKLHKTRKNAVPGIGPFDAKIVVLGRNPGKEEDLQALPFVGRAGKFLNELLHLAGLEREEVYITNPVKCFTPGNRPPDAEEVAACTPFLRKQIEIIKPRVIVALGNLAARVLLGEEVKISQVHGETFKKNEMHIFVTYHPSAGVRFPKVKKILTEDFLKLKRILKELGLLSPP